jgi:peptidoglycan hydrolase CwlO-like protein
MKNMTSSIDWSMWQAVAAWVVLIVTGVTYVLKNVFKLGGLSGRIDNVEAEIKELKQDVKDIDRNITLRMDQLIRLVKIGD